MACQKHPENVRLEQIIWTEKLAKKWSFLGGQLLNSVT